ncbi:glycosyltransferase family A protein [Thermosphaera sp.]
MKISVIVPSKGCYYLRYLMFGLRSQSVKPNEVILVIKDCDLKSVESLCNTSNIPCTIIEQREGYFTHALNIGKREAGGDIIIFTDDDAIPSKKWIERYIKLHKAYPNIAGISSRDIYIDLSGFKLLRTSDDRSEVRFYRWLIRPWLEPPHPVLRKYRLGVYLTKNLSLAHGPFIPSRTCYSLPFRGVNMSFKASYVLDVWFPEHKLLKRAPGNEQYFALQLVLKGFDLIYVPNNPVVHVVRDESLSRTKYRYELRKEFEVMRQLYKELLEKHDVRV